MLPGGRALPILRRNLLSKSGVNVASHTTAISAKKVPLFALLNNTTVCVFAYVQMVEKYCQ